MTATHSRPPGVAHATSELVASKPLDLEDPLTRLDGIAATLNLVRCSQSLKKFDRQSLAWISGHLTEAVKDLRGILASPFAADEAGTDGRASE